MNLKSHTVIIDVAVKNIDTIIKERSISAINVGDKNYMDIIYYNYSHLHIHCTKEQHVI